MLASVADRATQGLGGGVARSVPKKQLKKAGQAEILLSELSFPFRSDVQAAVRQGGLAGTVPYHYSRSDVWLRVAARDDGTVPRPGRVGDTRRGD